MIPAKIPQLGDLSVECWLTEEHTREMEVTENPIEIGSPVVDHAFIKAQELVVEFGVSNLPLGAITDSFGTRGTDRIEHARELLFAMQDSRQLLTIQTITGGIYKDMLLKKITWRTDKKSVHAVKFALTLKELRITQTQETQYTPIPVESKTKKQVDDPKKKGEKPAKETKSDTADKQEAANKAAKGSLLYRILN